MIFQGEWNIEFGTHTCASEETFQNSPPSGIWSERQASGVVDKDQVIALCSHGSIIFQQNRLQSLKLSMPDDKLPYFGARNLLILALFICDYTLAKPTSFNSLFTRCIRVVGICLEGSTPITPQGFVLPNAPLQQHNTWAKPTARSALSVLHKFFHSRSVWETNEPTLACYRVIYGSFRLASVCVSTNSLTSLQKKGSSDSRSRTKGNDESHLERISSHLDQNQSVV